MLLLSPRNFSDYELIDCGGFEKLERFGKFVTIRPEPQALWDKGLSEKEWKAAANVRFVSQSSSSGEWQRIKEMPERWTMEYGIQSSKFKVQSSKLKFRLGLTSFKHVGIFPEQSENWDYIYESVKMITVEAENFLPLQKPRVLNLFAYTGGASLAAKAAGADVTHLDSVKQVVTWAKENMELSGLQDIRWVVEDAMTFVQREVKRGKKYHGIILDPPAYGHGTDGKKWKLEEMINEMIKNVLKLLEPNNSFLLLNCYSLGFSSLIIEDMLKCLNGLETGELFLPSKTGFKLPLGVFGRVRNIQM